METFCEESERSRDLKEEGLAWQRGSWELGGVFSPEKHLPCVSENGSEGPEQHAPSWEEEDKSDGERGRPVPEYWLFFPLCLMVLRRAWRGGSASGDCHQRGRDLLTLA